jgi:predicted Zn-dependent protease
MRKIILEFLALVAFFICCWLGLSQIHWSEIFEVKEKTSQIENALGDFYMEIITRANKEIEDSTFVKPLEEIKNRICTDNGIDPETIQLHLVRSNDVNAFALPGRHIVILSDLIPFCKTSDELAGVMAHEIVHIQKNHIMKKLGKEIGFSALATMLNSGAGSAETLKMLTSTAYDRKMEAEADQIAVEYLQAAKINPAGLADFLYRLSVEEADWQKHLTIVSTHPETEQRAQTILDLMREKHIEYIPALPDSVWARLQEN